MIGRSNLKSGSKYPGLQVGLYIGFLGSGLRVACVNSVQSSGCRLSATVESMKQLEAFSNGNEFLAGIRHVVPLE